MCFDKCRSGTDSSVTTSASENAFDPPVCTIVCFGTGRASGLSEYRAGRFERLSETIEATHVGSQSMIGAKAFLGIVLVAAAPGLAAPIGLQTETVKAWEEYIRSTDLGAQTRSETRKPFLWTDELADRRMRVRRGEILVAPV